MTLISLCVFVVILFVGWRALKLFYQGYFDSKINFAIVAGFILFMAFVGTIVSIDFVLDYINALVKIRFK